MKNIKLVSIRGNYCSNFPLNNVHVFLIIMVRFFSVSGEEGGGGGGGGGGGFENI